MIELRMVRADVSLYSSDCASRAAADGESARADEAANMEASGAGADADAIVTGGARDASFCICA